MALSRGISRALRPAIARVLNSGSVGGGDESYDEDAEAWFTAVEESGASFDLTAEKSFLTPSYVKRQFDNWFLGAKSQGVFGQLDDAAFFVGISSFTGILVKFVGGDVAFTNENFAASDYNPLLGLKGNKTNKRLLTGRAANSLGTQNDRSLAVFVTEVGSTPGILSHAGTGSGNGLTLLRNNTSSYFPRINANASPTLPYDYQAKGLVGGSRNNSSNIDWSLGAIVQNVAQTSATPSASGVTVFSAGSLYYSDGRLAAYFQGRDLNLRLLHELTQQLVWSFQQPLATRLAFDGMWNQWIEPVAVASGSDTYVGDISSGGYIKVRKFDSSRQQVQEYPLAKLTIDDHNAPAILLGSGDGEPSIVFYANHGTETKLYYRVSATGDLADLGSQQELTFSVNATYAQAFRRSSDGRIIVFCRQRTVSDITQANWAYRYSDDGGSTWSSQQNWLNGEYWTYHLAKWRVPGEILAVAAHIHPSSGSNQDIFYCEINLDTGDITKPDGTVLGDIWNSGDLPINLTDLDIVQDPTGTRRTRLWDVNQHREVIFAEWAAGSVGDSQVDGKYYFAKHNGTVWVTTELSPSGTFLDGEPRGYVGGASLTSEAGEYVISTDLNTGVWHIYRGQVTAGVDGTLTQLSTGATGNDKKIRPKIPIDANEHIPVVWIEGRYTTFTDYDTDLFR